MVGTVNYHPEDGHMSGRNMSVDNMYYSYIHKSKRICCHFYISLHLINARSVEHIKAICPYSFVRFGGGE